MIAKNFFETGNEVMRNLQFMTRNGASLGGILYSHQTHSIAYHCRFIRGSLLQKASIFITRLDCILIIVNIPRILGTVYKEIETESIFHLKNTKTKVLHFKQIYTLSSFTFLCYC